jgi:DNA-binding GntR family transcriptional regulator
MDFRRPPTAQQAVLDELRRVIGSGELPPGAQVRQESLAERLGVSRVPLREALKILEGEGQVVHTPHRGYFVADLSVADLVEVYRIRDLLESEAARLAAGRLNEVDLAAMRQAALECDAAAEAGDLSTAIAANRRFHFTLLAAAGMPRLLRLIRQLWEATDAYRAVYYNDASHRVAVADDHAAILAAAEAADGDLLAEALRHHREAAVLRLRELLPAAEPSG